jgi:hypothetical protein
VLREVDLEARLRIVRRAGTQFFRMAGSYDPLVTIERRWGQPLWVWHAFALSTVPPVVFLLFSLTVSGRAFAVMVLIAEAFAAFMLFMGWARAERERFEAELGGADAHEPRPDF